MNIFGSSGVRRRTSCHRRGRRGVRRWQAGVFGGAVGKVEFPASPARSCRLHSSWVAPNLHVNFEFRQGTRGVSAVKSQIEVYRAKANAMTPTRSAIFVDVHTSRPDVENYGINRPLAEGTNHARRGPDRDNSPCELTAAPKARIVRFRLRQRGRVFSLRCLYLSPGRPVGASCIDAYRSSIRTTSPPRPNTEPSIPMA